MIFLYRENLRTNVLETGWWEDSCIDVLKPLTEGHVSEL